MTTPTKLPAPTANAAERKRRQRQRTSAAGGRQVAVHLSAREAAALNALVAAGRTQRDAIGAAILAAAQRIE